MGPECVFLCLFLMSDLSCCKIVRSVFGIGLSDADRQRDEGNAAAAGRPKPDGGLFSDRSRDENFLPLPYTVKTARGKAADPFLRYPLRR